MHFRAATRPDLPQLVALLADTDAPTPVPVTDAHERAFAAIDGDPRNELLVLDAGDGAVLGFSRPRTSPAWATTPPTAWSWKPYASTPTTGAPATAAA